MRRAGGMDIHVGRSFKRRRLEDSRPQFRPKNYKKIAFEPLELENIFVHMS